MSGKYGSGASTSFNLGALTATAAGLNQIMKRRRFVGLNAANKRGRSQTMTERIPRESAGFGGNHVNSAAGAKTVVKGRKKTALQKLLMIQKMQEASVIHRFQGINARNPLTQLPRMDDQADGPLPGYFYLNKQWTSAVKNAMYMPVYAFNLTGPCALHKLGGQVHNTIPMYRLVRTFSPTAGTAEATANYNWTSMSGTESNATGATLMWRPEKDNMLTSQNGDKYFYENCWANIEMAFYLNKQVGTKAKIHTSFVKFKGNSGPKRQYQSGGGGTVFDDDAPPTELEQHNIDLWWDHFLERHLVNPISSVPSWESKKPFLETSKDCTCLASDPSNSTSATPTNFIKRIFFKDNSLYRYTRTENAEEFNKPNTVNAPDALGYPQSVWGVQNIGELATGTQLSHRGADTWLLIVGDNFGIPDNHDSTSVTRAISFDFKCRVKQIYNSTD